MLIGETSIVKADIISYTGFVNDRKIIEGKKKEIRKIMFYLDGAKKAFQMVGIKVGEQSLTTAQKTKVLFNLNDSFAEKTDCDLKEGTNPKSYCKGDELVNNVIDQLSEAEVLENISKAKVMTVAKLNISLTGIALGEIADDADLITILKHDKEKSVCKKTSLVDIDTEGN